MDQQGEEAALQNGGGAAMMSSKKKPRARRRIWSKLAVQRRRTLDESQARAEARLRRKEGFKKGWKSAKNLVQKLNIGKWIDDLEKDQVLADQLEDANDDLQQEVARKALVIAVKEECMDAIRVHLRSFLEEEPDGMYEDWIAELHPDNYNEEKQTVDARFYVQDSDHRLLWNQQHETKSEKIVPARNIEHDTAVTSTHPAHAEMG